VKSENFASELCVRAFPTVNAVYACCVAGYAAREADLGRPLTAADRLAVRTGGGIPEHLLRSLRNARRQLHQLRPVADPVTGAATGLLLILSPGGYHSFSFQKFPETLHTSTDDTSSRPGAITRFSKRAPCGRELGPPLSRAAPERRAR
jgi:hypothetical protein